MQQAREHDRHKAKGRSPVNGFVLRGTQVTRYTGWAISYLLTIFNYVYLVVSLEHKHDRAGEDATPLVKQSREKEISLFNRHLIDNAENIK